MSKELLLRDEALPRLMSGIDKLTNAVKSTLGAKGRTVIIGKPGNMAHITKDGVTVAEAVHLKDEIENLGATIVKEAASKTGDIAGDGTTTATIIAHSIISQGLEAIQKGANPMDLKIGIDKAVQLAVENLKELAQPAKDDQDIYLKIATISANNDPEVGKIIAEVFQATGKDGVITVEESKSYDTSISIIDGMQVDGGYLSPYFITNQSKKTCELINPHIILCSGNITMMKDVVPIIDKIANDHGERGEQFIRPIVFIADSVREEALYTLVTNHIQNRIHVCAVAAPSWGDTRKAIMEDLAAITGATYIAEEKGLKLETAELTHVGGCEKIIIDEGKTIIYKGKGSQDAVADRLNMLKEEIETVKDERKKTEAKRRYARLQNGVAIVYVGGATQIEVDEKKDRIDDAICATRATAEEGYVAGGGITHMTLSNMMDDHQAACKDESTGWNIVANALTAPLRQMLENAGVNYQSFLFKLIDEEYGYGYNMKTDEYEDLFDAGVIDPAKVARVTLEHAASVAGIFLTTECVIGDHTDR